MARARAVAPAFALDPVSAPLIAQTCRRLDGIPLALELAAARLSVLGLPQLVARLDDRFHLLTTGNRMGLPRCQTLRATLDWSYSLLVPSEQILLRRLSVFDHSFTLDMAEAVAAGDDLAPEDVLDALAGLASKSLLMVEDAAVEVVHYRLLETVRAYAADQLRLAKEADATRLRRLQHAA